MELRDYQKECISIIPEAGSHLIQMATGLGKTATFTHIPRHGRVLILAHREELVKQPMKYYDCPVGVELAGERSHGEEVVIASVASMVRRLERFDPRAFDMIITDEAHHAAAQSYKKIYAYFKPRLHLGFTATPNRGDNVRLDDVYEDIIYQRDLRWAIEHGYLTDIHCLRVNVGYDISHVARRMGDWAPGELEEALNVDAVNGAIAEAYRKYAKGQTLIFAASVKHAQAIAERIDGAVAVTAATKDRADIIERFTRREIPVLVNCMIFTEGTDMPLVETVMIARPTSNSSLYTQMVGRGLRLYPGKDKLTLIDLVGVTGKASLCTAPTLIGVDMDAVPKGRQDEVEGDLFDLPDIIAAKSDCIESWIKNVELVDLWAKAQDYVLHDINFFKQPNGDLTLHLGRGMTLRIPAADELGRTVYAGREMTMQEAIDKVYAELKSIYADKQSLWDLKIVRRWGRAPATENQIKYIRRRMRGKVTDAELAGLTKMQASNILNRVAAIA